MRYSNVYWTELNWTDLVGRSLSFTQTTFRRHILGWKLYVLRHVIRPLLSDNYQRLLGCWPCCSRTSSALEHTQSADKLTFNIHSEHIFSTTGYRLQSTNACTAVTALSLSYLSLLCLSLWSRRFSDTRHYTERTDDDTELLVVAATKSSSSYLLRSLDASRRGMIISDN